MHKMTRLRRHSRYTSALVAFCLALCLGLGQGCARSEPLHPADASAPAGSKQQQLPFHPDTEQASAGQGAGAAVSPDPKLAGRLPFRTASNPRILPSGTLLTVQLEGSLSTATARVGDAFTASVAAPLTIDGDTLIQRGTAVTGRVESAQSQPGHPGLVPGSGYFRLTLSSITVEGRPIELQTSSLFARGTLQPSNISASANPSDLRSGGVRVQKGRPLTFRLTAPVTLDDPNSTANRQSLGRTTE